MGVLYVVDTFADGGFSSFKSAKVRSSKLVFPGEVFRTEMWKANNEKVLYLMVVKGKGGTDRVVISQATIELL